MRMVLVTFRELSGNWITSGNWVSMPYGSTLALIRPLETQAMMWLTITG